MWGTEEAVDYLSPQHIFGRYHALVADRCSFSEYGKLFIPTLSRDYEIGALY